MNTARSVTSGLLRGGAWVLAARIFSSGGSFAVSMLLARLLSQEDVGSYYLALSSVTALAIVGRAGLERTALSLVSNCMAIGDTGRARAVIARSLVASAFFLLLLSLAVATWGPEVLRRIFHASTLARMPGLIALWLVFLGFEVLVSESFRGLDLIPAASVFGGALSRALLVLLLSASLIASRAVSLDTALMLSCAALVLSLAIAGYFLHRQLASFSRTARTRLDNGELFRVAAPLMATNLAFFVMTSIDLWIVAAQRSEAETGLYAVAVRLVLLVGASMSVVNAILPPLIARLNADADRSRLQRVLRGAASLAGLPTAVVLMLYIVAGGHILRIGFGTPYQGAWPILATLSIGQLFAVWAGSSGYLLMIAGQQRALMWASFLGASLTAGGAIALVSRFGALGVAISSALGFAAQHVMMVWLAKRRCGVWTHAGIRPLREAIRGGITSVFA